MILGEDAQVTLKVFGEVCEARGVGFVMIGASALAVYAQSSELSMAVVRMTRDVDMVVSTLSWSDYRDLLDALIERGFRSKANEPEHRLFFGEVMVDILPYGDGLIDEDSLTWPRSGLQMNARGLKEALATARLVEMDGGFKVKVIPPWLFVYLKAIAYVDRRSEKDLRDVINVLTLYEGTEDINSRRFDVHEEGIDYEASGAFLVGKDIAEYLPIDEVNELHSFFKLFEDDHSSLVDDVAVYPRMYVKQETSKLLRAMLLGLGLFLGRR